MKWDTNYCLKIIIKIVMLLLIISGIFIAYKLAVFYIPFIIAMLIATLVEPLIKLIMKIAKIKRKTAAIIALVLVVAIIGTMIGLLITKVVSESTNLLSNLNTHFDSVYKWGMGVFNNIENIEIPEEALKVVQNSLTSIIDTAKTIVINLVTGLVNAITSIPTMITYIFITILAIIFICFDREYIPNIIKSQVPTKWTQKVKQIFNEMCSVSIKYIKAEAKLSFICFVLVLIGLLLFDLFGLNVQYPIIMAIFIGFIDMLPLFGAGAVMIPWVVYLVITGNVPLAIGVAILWGFWAIIKQFMEPKMVSTEMGMHPIFTLIGMYTGFKLAGVIGLILGPIIFIIIKNIFKELINKGVLKSFFEIE